jgi:hypothetical protein
MLFTGVLAFATVGLGAATVGLYRTGEKQIDLVNKTFIATHRPRIVVRHVQGPFRTPEDRLLAWITFANIGPTEATIVAIGYDLGLWRDGHWIATGIDAEPKPIDPLSLPSGGRHTVEVVAKEADGDDALDNDIAFLWRLWNQPAVVREGPSPELCVVGEVRYRDGNGIIRHTGFWRVFDSQRRRWIPNQEFGGEYED